MEIPEGSNSAKARRSDIVANDDLEIQHNSSHFDADNTLTSEMGHFRENDSIASIQHVSEDQAGSHASVFQEKQDTRPDRFGPNQDAAHVKGARAMETKQGLSAGQDVPEGDFHPDNHQALAIDKPEDNRQGVANEAIHDHLQGITQDNLNDNLQGLAQDNLEDHALEIPMHPLATQQAGIPNLEDSDNQQHLVNEALQDHQATQPNEDLTDNFAALTNDEREDNEQGIDKKHLQDHVVALPDTPRTLKDGPKPAAADTDSTVTLVNAIHSATKREISSSPNLVRAKQKAVPLTEAELEAQAEKEKKLEEFHGRVEAIRKSVTGINHILDELDEDPKSKK